MKLEVRNASQFSMGILLAASILAGCSRVSSVNSDGNTSNSRASKDSADFVLAFNKPASQQGPSASSYGATVIHVTRDEIVPRPNDLSDNQRFSVVVFESGPGQNVPFCRALFGNWRPNLDVSAFWPLAVHELFWIDNRTASEVDANRARVGESGFCERLMEHHDFDAGRSYAAGFDLFGRAGPWIVTFGKGADVILDFSEYPVDELPARLANWNLYLIRNLNFWNERRAKDLGRVALAGYFPKELRDQRLQIRFKW